MVPRKAGSITTTQLAFAASPPIGGLGYPSEQGLHLSLRLNAPVELWKSLIMLVTTSIITWLLRHLIFLAYNVDPAF
ncbi:uncharacterized protein BDW43DRAFT_285446 [Aspergillus alliaceus]|uniref:uncharacterized protein n=1 Tax=Petromyces alliaceus TaxID=209559 RepID=UPI0012A415AE|nr:uncharacterized protein BDW43DRAFT_285446 [Aspergillus alliaceus]KAB8230449.1 hypothetical protein BDW43DRAFT_285446 [Aspergillus alliaceus]